MASYFITATGTEIGKTFLTCMLTRQLKGMGYSVRTLKPVISGWQQEGSDTAAILDSLGLPVDAAHIDNVSPWRFIAPLSPDMAAEKEGKCIPFDAVAAFCTAPSKHDFTLIEGAGGVMTPVDTQHTMLDLMAACDAEPILVTGSYLGSLSHTLTALAALASFHLKVKGVVVSETPNSTVTLQDTVSALERFTPSPVIALPRAETGKTYLNIVSMLSMIANN